MVTHTGLCATIDDLDRGALLDALSVKVRDIGRLEARLAQNRTRLVSLMAEIEAKPDDVDCATNATRALARWRVGAGIGLEPAAGVTKATRRRSSQSG